MSNSQLQTRISMYKCPFCNSIFYSLSDLRSHFFGQHKSENMKCPFCNFESKTYDEFALHLLMTKEKSHNDLLKLLFNQIKELAKNGNIFEIIQEVKSQNENENNKDNNSEIENKENQTLENKNVENDISQTQIKDNQVQTRKRKSKTKLKCPYCDYVTTWRKNLYHHITTWHTEVIHENKQEMKSQVDDIDYDKCPYCGKEYTRINELKLHINSVHLLNNYSCPFCKINFENPILLLAHLWNSNDRKHRYLHKLITRY